MDLATLLSFVGERPYTDSDHRRLDAQVIHSFNSLWKTEQQRATISAMPELLRMAVLQAVIETDNRLDPRRLEKSFIMFHEHPELESMLIDAWKAKSFRGIRSIDYLQAPRLRCKPIPVPQLNALREGLTSPYQGNAADVFYDYLGKVMSDPDAFGRVCSVAQSSGTGKTRLLLELAKKDVWIVYMNIRSPDDKLGFPPRDNVPADILTYPGDDAWYRKQCLAFFEAVFKVLGVFTKSSLGDLFSKDMCTIGSSVRKLFFMELQKEFVNVFHELAALPPGSPQMLPGSNPAENRRVVIVLDDAHIFQTDGLFFGRQGVLFDAIKSYSPEKWGNTCVVLASRTPEVARLPDLGHGDPRNSIGGQVFFQPFIQLGWDQHAPMPERVQADEVAKMEHILQYGRPLWSLLKEGFSPEQILELARDRLCGEREFVPDSSQALAVLGQRFRLDIARDHDIADMYAEEGVLHYLSVCIGMTEDWDWYETTYPPEPIVSCAAASILHEGDHLDRSLRKLEEMVQDRVIDGQLEVLLGRLLWLLAKDLFVRKTGASEITYANAQSEPELLDCQPVSVVEFLAFMLGPGIWEAAPQALQAFRNAYINFSHWVTKQSSDVASVDWSGIWQRTSAIQFEGDDKLIPVYFKPEQTGDRAGMSYILISGGSQTVAHDRFAPNSDLPYIAIAVDLGENGPGLDVVDISERKMGIRISASGFVATPFTFLDGPGGVVAQRLRELYNLRDAARGRDSPDMDDSD